MSSQPVMLPEMHVVKSSSIKALGYDDDSKLLYVQFLNGGVYFVYKDVPRKRVAELMQAKSLGSYFHKHVRSAYEYQQLDAKDFNTHSGVSVGVAAPENKRVRPGTSVRRGARIKRK